MMPWPQVMVCSCSWSRWPQVGLQGALCSHSRAPGIHPRDPGSASLQAQACWRTVLFLGPAGSPKSHSQLSLQLGHCESSSSVENSASPTAGRSAWPFFFFFFCNFTEMESADDHLQETAIEGEVQGQDGSSRWGEENSEIRVGMCVFPLPCPWAFQEAMLGRQAVRGCVGLTGLCSFLPRSPGGLG